MASRIVEILYQLKDAFTPTAKRISSAYRELGKAAETSSQQVTESNEENVTSISKTQGAIQALRKSIAGLASGITLGVIGKELIDAANSARQLRKESQALNQSVTQLERFRAVSAAAGEEAKTLETAYNRLATATRKAASGNDKLREAFFQLGVDVKEFSELSPEDQIRDLSLALRAIDDIDQRRNLARLLLGRDPNATLRILLRSEESLDRLFAKADEISSLNVELGTAAGASLAQQYDNITDSLGRAFDGFVNNALIATRVVSSGLKPAVDALSEVTDKYVFSLFESADAQEENNDATKKTVTTYKEAQKAGDDFIKSEKELTDTLVAGSKLRTAQIQKEAKERDKALKRQLDIEEEFNALIKDVSTPDLTAEDVSLIDVSLKQREAAAALERGESEKAIELAREGADLLQLLDEKGSETGGTLKFLAEQFKRVAVDAAQAQVDVEQGDLDQAVQTFAQFQQQADQLVAEAKTQGFKYGQEFNAGVQEAFSQNPVQPQVAPPRQAAREIIGTGSESDPFRFRTDLDTKGGK